MLGRGKLRPFAATSTSRAPIVAIFLTFALIFGTTILLTVTTTKRSQHQTSVIEIAARQRTLAERYVEEVLLVRAGRRADPAYTAGVLAESAAALLEGGNAPAVNGDDDQTPLAPAEGSRLRAQFAQEQRLVGDLTGTGEAVLARRPVTSLPETAHEHVGSLDPIMRLRVLAALASSIAFRAAREVGHSDEANLNGLLTTEVLLGVGGLVVALLLAGGLLATTRRQSAHFRSLALSSSDLVMVFGARGCRYVSRSLAGMLERPESELYGEELVRFVHPDDRSVLAAVRGRGEPAQFTMRMSNGAGEWRDLEVRVTDLRGDRHLRGVVLHARDTTERVRLERELTSQLNRDGFAAHLAEALEMADQEREVFTVVERAMMDISERTPMELLLSDSSRANLERVAQNATAAPPGCPVRSPFSCVAVRRGSAVTFDSSESLNACPQLRGRAAGPCSAVCVPVSFMGRNLGVLHTTGADGQPLGEEAIDQLTVLAGQAGARIGTVRAFEKTQLQASTDGLTGLVNRRTAEERLRELIRGGGVFALAIADLDKFKLLNDKHGHEAGDRALRLFAHTATATLRDRDMVARWGGEEFVIALPELDRFQAVEVLDRLRQALAEAHPGETARFTASFGVTDSTHAVALEQLLQIADGGLYAAKETGRDRVAIGDPEVALAPDPQPLPAPAANGEPGSQAQGNGRRGTTRTRRPLREPGPSGTRANGATAR
jgi:diguanylate cyclase (GGDEF)-like protein/PAS domain S-box-containing protein